MDQAEVIMAEKARVLAIGLDPEEVDYTRAMTPGLTKEVLAAAIEAERVKLEALGYRLRMLLIDTGKTAEAVVRQALEREDYDCVMIGAGVRVAPDHFLLFERLINVIHGSAAPTAKICFNTRPTDSVEAVQRWV
jgi:hypothetical protein